MKYPTQKSKLHAFSLVEVIVMVAVVGILSGIAIGSVGKITKASKETVAQNLVETLNNATKEFGHAQYVLVSDGENTNSTDEVDILRTLQWKDPGIELGIAGPFMRGDWIPASSSSNDDYRAVWAGSFWKLARPGEAGAGLKVDFEAKDLGTTFNHPSDFTPVKFVLTQSVEAVDDGESLTGDSLIDSINNGLPN